MPQLDKVHFFSQFFWLCVFYFGFYFLIAKHFLPRMARILQYRKTKMQSDSQGVAAEELQLVKESGKTALENIFSASNKFWSQQSARMQSWYQKNVQSLNSNYLAESNSLFIQKVGSYSLAQSTALGGAYLAKPTGCNAWFLVSKLRASVPNSMVGGQGLQMQSALKPTTKKKGHLQAPNGTQNGLEKNKSVPENNRKGKKGKK